MRATGHEFNNNLTRDLMLARELYRYWLTPKLRRRYLNTRLELDRRNRDKEPGTPVEVNERGYRVYFGTVVGRNGPAFRIRPDDSPRYVDEVYPQYVRDRH